MKTLLKALAAFQQEVPVIHKGTSGYGYTYANLSQIFEVINPLLKTHGLGFTQLICGQSVKTIIFHVESGEQLESITDIPQNVQLKGMNEFQVLGSAITYIRRYALSAALGLITDKDTDASGEQQPKASQPKENKEDNQWQNDKEWLNIGTPAFEKAKEAIKAGTHTIADVRKKYAVSKKTEEALNAQ
jgi:hypothetical protein